VLLEAGDILTDNGDMLTVSNTEPRQDRTVNPPISDLESVWTRADRDDHESSSPNN